jgi:hypothetical protein
MKFIITEDKRGRLIDEYLSEDYGGLKKGTEKNHPDLIFFIKDVEVPKAGDLVFHYNKESQSAVIPWEMVDCIRMFTSSEWESKQFIMRWLNKTYEINPVKLFKKF